MTRALLLSLLLLDTTSRAHLRYQRSVMVASAGPACVVLDAAVYTHATGSLGDLRLYADAVEIPYVLTMSGVAETDPAPARVTNLRQSGRSFSFDLTMPAFAYSEVVLDLEGRNFSATATVTADAASSTRLGGGTVFDLSAEHLGRRTSIALEELRLPQLHIVLAPLPGSPALATSMVRGATVPPSREAQTLYTPAVSTSTVTQQGSETRAKLLVPARLPIERLRVTLAEPAGQRLNFERAVRIEDHPAGESVDAGEQLTGILNQVHLTRGGAILDLSQLTVPATLGGNLQQAAEVQIAIENGRETPLPIAALALETRQHQICFQAPAHAALQLYYGGQAAPSRYEQSQLPAAVSGITGTLGPEQLNPAYVPTSPRRSLRERHPRLLYLGLLLVICLAAGVALRSKKLRF